MYVYEALDLIRYLWCQRHFRSHAYCYNPIPCKMNATPEPITSGTVAGLHQIGQFSPRTSVQIDVPSDSICGVTKGSQWYHDYSNWSRV